MIESTFLFLNGIGEVTEQKFWAHAVHTWTDFLLAREAPGLSLTRKQLYDDAVADAREEWQHDNIRFFGTGLPSRYQWRLYEWLRPEGHGGIELGS